MSENPDELLDKLNTLLDEQEKFEKIARKRVLNHLNFFLLVSYAIFFTALFLVEKNFHTICIMAIILALMVVKHIDLYYIAKHEIPVFRNARQGKIAKYAVHVTAFYKGLHEGKQKGE